MFSVNFGNVVDFTSYRNRKTQVKANYINDRKKLEREPESDVFVVSDSISKKNDEGLKSDRIQSYTKYFTVQNEAIQKHQKSPYKVAQEITPVLKNKYLMNAMMSAYESGDEKSIDNFYKSFHNLSRKLNDTLDKSKRDDINSLLSMYYEDSENLMYQGLSDDEKSAIKSYRELKEN